jgi:L-fuculose-phosphate aldolase
MNDLTVRPKAAYHAKMNREMQDHLKDHHWTPAQRVALACRMLDADGHASALAGQVTLRGERPGTYWGLSFGLGFDEATASNILLFDNDLNVLEGQGMANPANRFHLWIYGVRPEVSSIVHTHPPHASALSMIGEPLIVSHMDSCVLYENCAYLADWPGVPIGDEEGRVISEGLGDKETILLAHHGILTACVTLEKATVLAFYMERAAKLQLLARAVGPIRELNREHALEARGYRGGPKYVGATFNFLARSVLRASPECLD